MSALWLTVQDWTALQVVNGRDYVLNSLFTTLLYMAMIGVTFKLAMIGIYVLLFSLSHFLFPVYSLLWILVCRTQVNPEVLKVISYIIIVSHKSH